MRREVLNLPAGWEGRLWQHRPHGGGVAVHRHAELEVNLTLAGRATYLVDEQRYDLAPGTMIWLHPQQAHVLVHESADHAMWIGVFRPRLLHRVCTTPATRELRRARPTGVFCKQLGREAGGRLHALFADVAACEADMARYNAGLPFALLSAWALHVDADELSAGVDVHPAVERAARLLRDIAEPMSVEHLALEAGLSPSRLSRLFKQQTGVSLTHYRQRQQLQRYFELYGSGQRRTCMQAALEAGFGSYPQFHRVFKSHLGYGPAEHRQRLRRGGPSRGRGGY
ncbi:MAG: AraC family transcriptional regulator [Phycisphaeraceae bacterium]